MRNDPAAKPGDPPGRNEGGLRLDWLGDVGRIVLVFSLVGYLSVASFFLSKIITDFCNAFRKSVLTTNPRGANSFNYIRSLIVPSYREQTSVRKTIRQRTRIISEESKQRVELKHASPPRGVNLVVPGPSFTTKETRSCMTTRLHCSTVS